MRLFWPVLLAVLILAGGIRFFALGLEDYWLDELHSMANSAGRRDEFENLSYGVILPHVDHATDLTERSTAAAVWRTLRHDSHPPVYFWLLLGWRRLFGDGEAAVRALPVVFSILSIIPVALVFRQWGKPMVGLCAALFLALAFTHIQMAQENRPYSLSILLVSCGWYSLSRVELWARDEPVDQQTPLGAVLPPGGATRTWPCTAFASISPC